MMRRSFISRKNNNNVAYSNLLGITVMYFLSILCISVVKCRIDTLIFFFIKISFTIKLNIILLFYSKLFIELEIIIRFTFTRTYYNNIITIGGDFSKLKCSKGQMFFKI